MPWHRGYANQSWCGRNCVQGAVIGVRFVRLNNRKRAGNPLGAFGGRRCFARRRQLRGARFFQMRHSMQHLRRRVGRRAGGCEQGEQDASKTETTHRRKVVLPTPGRYVIP